MPESSPSHLVTLRDIAVRAGVDHSTVSLALHNSPKVSATRRAEIQKIAQEMGYRLNPFAAALSHQRHHSDGLPAGAEIAWINHWPEPSQLRHYREFNLYWEGAREAAERLGYRMEEFTCNAAMPVSRLQSILKARNVRGVLIPPLGRNSADLSALDWSSFAAVRFGHSLRHPRVPIVTSDQLSNGLLAFQNIQRLGYERIGFVTSTVVQTRFKAGFLMSQSELPESARVPILVLATGENDQEDLKRLHAWLEAWQPAAVLTEIAAMRDMLAHTGRSIPEDIGLATLSVLDGNADAGIYQNSQEIGKTAVEILVSQIHYNHWGAQKICHETLIEGDWIDGSTLPPR